MGGISDSTREQIRAASDIVEIIGAVVPLKRAGANFVGLCPFHREKTPSFNVSPSRQMFRCFGCGKGGDVFRFLMDYENLTFPEAMRRLAERAHIVIQEENTPGAADSRALKDKLLTIHEQIAQRWQNALTTDPGSQIARDYIAKRRVPEEMVKLFRIGYAPDAWDDTVNWARSKNFDLELVAQSGLIVKRDGAEGYYDRFRGRLMFPICDEQGRIVAFSGRVLKEEQLEYGGKYVNSPETPIFTKGRIIFGLDKAKRAILDSQLAVVCEGQLDMIACYSAGVENTVAPQGTAFTAEHARILKRYTKEVILCFDSDNAGQKAAVRALDDLIHSGLAIRVATIPKPHDPDSFVKEFGAEAFNQLIQNAVGFFDFYLDLLCKQNDAQSDRGQKEIARAMASALEKANDPILFERYARKTAARLGADPIQAVNAFKRLAKETPQVRARDDDDNDLPQETGVPEIAPPSAPELWILKLALLNDENLEWLAAHLDFHWIDHPDARTILEHRLTQDENSSWRPPTVILHELTESSAQALLTQAVTDSFLSKPDELGGHIGAVKRQLSDPFANLRETVTQLRNRYIDRQLTQIATQMTDPQANIAELFARRKALRATRTAPLTPISDTSEF